MQQRTRFVAGLSAVLCLGLVAAVLILRGRQEGPRVIVHPSPVNAPSTAELSSDTEDPPLPPPAHRVARSRDVDAALRTPVLSVAAAGEIKRRGFYELPFDSRVQDLIDRAGGLTPRGDLSDINIAARLVDGTTLTIPELPGAEQKDARLVIKRVRKAAELNPPFYTRSGWRPPVAAGIAAATTGAAPTSATPQPARATPAADGLIDLNHASLAELDTLPGIGPKTAEKIMQYRSQNPFRSVDDLDNVHGIGEKKLEAVRHLVTVR